YFVHRRNVPSSSALAFLHSRLAPFSTCWIVGPYLHFLEVGIVQFVDLPGSFSGLVGLRLSDAPVGVVVAVGSAWAISWAGCSLVHLQSSLMWPDQSSVPD